MAIDASIPLRVEQFNLSDVMGNAQNMRLREAQMRHYDAQAREAEEKRAREAERQASLSDLIASRGPNGAYDTKGPAFQRLTQAAPEDAFKLLGQMDEQQRKHAEAGLKDMAAAVQWADTPQKWAVVQQHYGQYDPQLAAVPFEQREQALVQLGQMDDYLKNTKPDIRATEPGGGLYSVDPRGGGVRTLVQPNDGSQPMGAPVGASSGGPRPGAVVGGYRFKGGNPNDRNNWTPAGGGSGDATGNFQPVGLQGERITSTRRSAAHNRAVGGVSNSYHLSGRARDSVPPPGMSMAQYAAELRRRNPHMEVINEGDHVHIEPRG